MFWFIRKHKVETRANGRGTEQAGTQSRASPASVPLAGGGWHRGEMPLFTALLAAASRLLAAASAAEKFCSRVIKRDPARFLSFVSSSPAYPSLSNPLPPPLKVERSSKSHSSPSLSSRS